MRFVTSHAAWHIKTDESTTSCKSTRRHQALALQAGCTRAGVSARHDYDMNSLAVPRKAKESIGGIAALRRPDGTALTINVEYNLLDPLLRANGYPDGDVNDASGWSPFPGLPAQHRTCCALRDPIQRRGAYSACTSARTWVMPENPEHL